MKKLFTLFMIMALTINVFAQVPQKMSYQAVIRDAGSALIKSHAIGMRISILQGSASGTPVYVETQTPTTNANGLVTIEIGGGTIVTGTFASINWLTGTYFIKTETDPTGGTNYSITGTSQVLSVPYALYAKNAGSYSETDPVFSVSPSSGITSGSISNWNTAYGWGNHAGLYKLNSYMPNWVEITGKPTFAVVATSGLYADLSGKPTLFSGSFTDLTNKPTTLAGYGITDADGSTTNEIQSLSLSGTTLTLSLGGGTVTLPSAGGSLQTTTC